MPSTATHGSDTTIHWVKKPVRVVYNVELLEQGDALNASTEEKANATSWELPQFVSDRLENRRNFYLNYKADKMRSPTTVVATSTAAGTTFEAQTVQARAMLCYEYLLNEKVKSSLPFPHSENGLDLHNYFALEEYEKSHFRNGHSVLRMFVDVEGLRLMPYDAMKSVQQQLKGVPTLDNADRFFANQKHLKLIRTEVLEGPWFDAQRFRLAAFDNDTRVMTELYEERGRSIVSAPGKHGVRTGKSAIFCAAMNLNLEALELLLSWDKHTHPDAPEHCNARNGTTPLMAALKWNSGKNTTPIVKEIGFTRKEELRVDRQRRVVQLLLGRGADPSACLCCDPKMKKNRIRCKIAGSATPGAPTSAYKREQQRISALTVALDACVHPTVLALLLDECAKSGRLPCFALPLDRELAVAEKKYMSGYVSGTATPSIERDPLKRRKLLQDDRSSMWHAIIRRLALTNAVAPHTSRVLAPSFSLLHAEGNTVAHQQKAFHDLQYLSDGGAGGGSGGRSRTRGGGRRGGAADDSLVFDAQYTRNFMGTFQFAPLDVQRSPGDAKILRDAVHDCWFTKSDVGTGNWTIEPGRKRSVSSAAKDLMTRRWDAQGFGDTAMAVDAQQFALLLGCGFPMKIMPLRSQPWLFVL